MVAAEHNEVFVKINSLGNLVNIFFKIGGKHFGVAAVLVYLIGGCFNQNTLTGKALRLLECRFNHKLVCTAVRRNTAVNADFSFFDHIFQRVNHGIVLLCWANL